ncbi:FAD-dependent oxidoreductase [Streptomyces apricus]|uniref:Monooxygenase n=1 Tax=Streptomyces apricus TaxID=1828112 RepID=A0A5B0AEH4_9ACTN|nr:FAD-dependent oxidoreductase [Streptomyces apricus]KAA0926995.1 monooxygenase [Streptomyces apricus]
MAAPAPHTSGRAHMQVLVIGGGIAGTAAALALHAAGAEVTVHEAHPDAAEDIGAFLTLASNGMRALARLDASAAVTALGFPLHSMRVLDATGAVLADVALGEADDPLLRYRCLHRAELATALQAEAVRRGIHVRHGARLDSFEETPDDITAHFTDGSTATGDLLVGADGLHSAVRRHIAPDVRPRYAGQRVFYGYADDAAAAGANGGDSERITMVRGSAAAFGHAVSPDGLSYWFARVAGEPLTADETGQVSASRLRELLLPLLRRDDTPAADIVAATKERVMVTDATELPVGTRWRSGRALTIGDAAHAASPATGQGASLALEDAVVLADCLRDTPDIARALSCYESLRRPRVEENITVSGNISRGTPPPSAPSPSSS